MQTALTYDDLRDSFIYGELTHVEVGKKFVYERWKNIPLGIPMLQCEFDHLLGNVRRAIS
ncbi:MAG TPA: hypothetical protein VGP82_01520 [Ktedonobacterales bacterium]|jgi:hypothetical protein|nr:hypothetical protein [Ktedonobacterales bacterium]